MMSWKYSFRLLFDSVFTGVGAGAGAGAGVGVGVGAGVGAGADAGAGAGKRKPSSCIKDILVALELLVIP